MLEFLDAGGIGLAPLQLGRALEEVPGDERVAREAGKHRQMQIGKI